MDDEGIDEGRNDKAVDAEGGNLCALGHGAAHNGGGGGAECPLEEVEGIVAARRVGEEEAAQADEPVVVGAVAKGKGIAANEPRKGPDDNVCDEGGEGGRVSR